jgi:hypothetical protein
MKGSLGMKVKMKSPWKFVRVLLGGNLLAQGGPYFGLKKQSTLIYGNMSSLQELGSVCQHCEGVASKLDAGWLHRGFEQQVMMESADADESRLYGEPWH